MPQEDLKQNDKNNFPRFRPRGDDDNGQRKRPKFSIYWIWGIIAAVLIGFNLFGSFSPDAHQINDLDFRKDMLANGDVDKIDLVSNKQMVRVYIKKDSLNKPYYSKFTKSNSWPGGVSAPSRASAPPVNRMVGRPPGRLTTPMSRHQTPRRIPVPSALEQASLAANRLA